MTAFTDLVSCRLPIQLASLGGIGTPALAAAVSDAGGLGMIANPPSAAEVNRSMESARALTSRPIGIGFLIPFVAREAVEAAGASADIVEFFYGDPDPDLVRVARARGTLVAWQTGSAGEALAAEKAGCDFVVAQGVEAGTTRRRSSGRRSCDCRTRYALSRASATQSSSRTTTSCPRSRTSRTSSATRWRCRARPQTTTAS